MKILIFIVALATSLQAQPLVLEEGFTSKLEAMQLEFVAPVDGNFKLRPSDDLRRLHIDQTLWSRSEKLEVRIGLLQPEDLGNLIELPDMAARQLVMDLASNEETAPPISVHRFGEEEMKIFQADWARQYTFQPKQHQIPYRIVQLTALFKRGRGMAYLLLLFDHAPDTLDSRQQMLRFAEE
ncbi:MAG: hypothetical protein AAGF87_12770 [Bacteroidota bacterium]